MNQILQTKSNSNENNLNFNTIANQKKIKRTKLKKIYIYILQFVSSSIIAGCFIFMFFWHIFKSKENEKISEQLLDIYTVCTLYSNNINYSAEFVGNSSNINTSDRFTNPFVIGIIKIDKINLNYPILSNSTKELLDISPCRFAGPMPNQIGNLCIAGHNYVDCKFFSRLNELEKNDIIKIYDITGNLVEYTVSEKYEVNPNDMTCASQDTHGQRLLTLITCNNVSGKRLVVLAEPKDL